MSFPQSHRMMQAAFCLALTIAVLCASQPILALAQATPTAGELDVPLPQECKIEPRELPLFPPGVGQQTAATPAPVESVPAAPFVASAGDPADAETVAAVSATVRESLACRNGNDLASAYALFTPEMLVALFGGPATIDPEVSATLAEDVGPLPRRLRVALVAVNDIVMLPDGRAGAVVETMTLERAFRDYLFFVLDASSGRWLIDEVEALPAP